MTSYEDPDVEAFPAGVAKRGELTESQKEQKAEREKAQMAQMLGGDAKTFAAQQDDTYDKARESKMYQGLLSFDELKKRKALIESGALEESAQDKAARALKADAVLAAKEDKARLERLEAKKRKTVQEASGNKDAKKEPQKKKAAVLSFTADDEDQD